MAPDPASKVVLQPHQVEGVEFILRCYRAGHGMILADEMGLGKTCQAVTFLKRILEIGKKFLVLTPLSVQYHWTQEFKKFASSLKVLQYVGNKDERDELRAVLDDESVWDVLLTSYEIFLRDSNLFHRNFWDVVIVDEAHRLKNSESLFYLKLNEIKFDFALLLTGTPIQNDLGELYSLLSVIDKRKFSINLKDEFLILYDSHRPGAVDQLQRLLAEYLLRRSKSSSCFGLTEKMEQVIYHGLTELQRKIYLDILRQNYEFLQQKNSSSRVSLMNTLVQLRKCVDHPYLFPNVEPEPFEEGEHLVEASAKLYTLDLLLKYLFATGHKTLIFSQMTRMLDILQDYLTFRGYPYERMDGSVRAEERFNVIRHFTDDEDVFVFLLSTRAGGLGINLSAADTVIFYDSDFNPQTDLQAADRVHRIGQEKPVKIIRLVCKNTVDETIVARAKVKLTLARQVFDEDLVQEEDQLDVDDIRKMITFGLSKLQDRQDGEEELAWTASKLSKFLGRSRDGRWVPSYSPQRSPEAATTADVSDLSSRSIYLFEGKDYKARNELDEEALNSMVEGITVAALSDDEADRSHLSLRQEPHGGELLPARKPPRRPLSPEQRQRRLEKRQETLKRKMLEEARRKEEQERRRLNWWKKSNYTSFSFHPKDEAALADVSDELQALDIRYKIGDVTRPQLAEEDNRVVIVHCVDNSGEWGTGGIFDALARLPKIRDYYESAKRMLDLKLGDLHVVPADELDPAPGRAIFVALIVSQSSRNRRVFIIKHFTDALKKLAIFVHENHCSVHMPRIGFGLTNCSWYTVERLVNKYLVLRGVPTYVYYFQRHLRPERKQKAHESGEEKSDDLLRPSTSSERRKASVVKDKEEDEEVRDEQSDKDNDKDEDYHPEDDEVEEDEDEEYESGDEEIDDVGEEEEQRLRVKTKRLKPSEHREEQLSLPNVFSNMRFMFSELTDNTTAKLGRLVTAFDGSWTADILDLDITHVIVQGEEDLQKIQTERTWNPKVKFATVEWLKNCIRMKKVLEIPQRTR